MEREPARITSRRGDYVDVIIAIVIPRVRDHRSVRREDRMAQGSRAGYQTHRIATLTADNPDVAAIVEGDLSLAERGILQEQRTGIRRHGQKGGEQHKKSG